MVRYFALPSMLHPLEHKVRSLGRLAKLLTVVHGAARLICLVAGTAMLLGLADFLLYAFVRIDDAGLRLIFSAAALGACGAGSYLFLWPAVAHRWTELEVARRLERRFPDLSDRLSSSIEFLRQPEEDDTVGSATLRRSVIAETTSYVEQLRLLDAVKLRPFLLTGLAGLVVLGVALTLVTVSNPARLAAKRLLLPWSAAAWPRQNNLRFDNPPSRLAKGEDFEVLVSGRLPDAVTFHYRFVDDDRVQSKPMKPLGDRMVVRLDHVTQTFQYRATGGDDSAMPWHWLEVVEPPEVSNLEVELVPPPYTGWPRATSSGHIHALQGTQVRLAGISTKRLMAIGLKFEAAQAEHAIAGRLREDRRTFIVPADPAVPWVVGQSGTYWLEMTDEQGLVGGKRQQWQVTAVSDGPPTVMLEQPSGDSFVTPKAVVPLKGLVRDDLAIQSIELRWVRSEATGRGEQMIGLYRGREQTGVTNSQKLAANAEPGDAQTVTFSWDLTELKGLQAGQSIELHLSASDYKPQVGQSTLRRLVIISASELEDRIGQRQTYLLGQLAEALRVQRQSRSQTRSLEIQLDETNTLDLHDIDQLQSAELNQREVQHLLSAPNDGVEAQIAAVLADLDSNRLEGSDVRRYLTDLLSHVRRLNESHIPVIRRDLISTLKRARAFQQDIPPDASAQRTFPSEVRQSLVRAGREQDQVITVIEQLLGELSQWDNYQRMVREIRQIRTQQDELTRRTEEASRDLIGKNLEELTSHETADLRILARQQSELSRRFDAASSRLEKMRERWEEQDPAAAGTISDALEAASRLAISGGMRQASRDIERNLLGQATMLQQHVVEGLEGMLDTLSHREEQRADRLVDKLRQAAGQLEGLRDRLKAVCSGIQDAASLRDPQEQHRQLERLSREVHHLGQQLERLARQLRRLQADRASGLMEQAEAKLHQSGQSAGQGETARALDQAESAEQQLDDSRRELAEAIRRADQKLYEEKLTQFGQQVAGLAGRQQSLIEETLRLEQLRQTGGPLTDEQMSSVRSLARQQRAVATETGILASRAEDAEAFALVLRSAVREMLRAAQHLDRAETGPQAQRAEEIALTRLNQLIEAAKLDAPQGPDDAADPESQQLLPGRARQVLAELKLLQLLQKQINRQTADLEEARLRRGGVVSEDQQRELKDLAIEQGQLADLIFNLSPPSQPNPENDPDNLPDFRQ